MSATVTGTVRFRCGAHAMVEYPADAPEVLARFRAEAAARDGAGCVGDTSAGIHLQIGDDRIDGWSYRDVTPRRPEEEGRES